ncbi:MAG: hypothetical protein GF350_00485 [Chitinivibrionales bacterium]|nr:hypothetical protein [Chitinivibrionales bacterium]
MGKRTWANLRDDVEVKLTDTGNATFAEATIDEYMKDILVDEVSDRVPVEVLEVLTATASREYSLYTITNLLRVLDVEYKVAQWPRCWRNFKVQGYSLFIDLDDTPTAGNSIYVWCAKPQRITETSDLAGAVKLLHAAGETDIDIDGLAAADTIYADTCFTIAGDTTVYRVTADVALAGNEGNFSIYPALQAAAADDAVVTFETSTLTPELERIFSTLVAGKLAIDYAQTKINVVNDSGVTVPDRYLNWGTLKWNEAIAKLEAMRKPRVYRRHPTS